MKAIYKIMTVMVLCVSCSTVSMAQDLRSMPVAQRDSLLISIAKKTVLTYGPDWYREYRDPVIERHQIQPPPNVPTHPEWNYKGRYFYRVTFLIDQTQERVESDFAARVSIWEDTGEPYSVWFGSNTGFILPIVSPVIIDGITLRAEGEIPRIRYSTVDSIRPIWNLREMELGIDSVPAVTNREELLRNGFEEDSFGRWRRTSPRVCVPPEEAQVVIRRALEELGLPVTIYVTGISLIPNAAALYIGATSGFLATVRPANANNRSVSWTSSNTAVATVDGWGRVTAVSAGKAVIVATADGGHTATATVTVSDPPHLPVYQDVVIAGVHWATRNVGSPGSFAASPESAGMLFQWNRRQGWSSTGASVIGWDATLPTGTSWTRANDPCPAGWRVPTEAELRSLMYANSTWITKNGVNGHLFGTAPNQIFLPAVGIRFGDNGSLHGVGQLGYYWSSTQLGSELAWYLDSYSGRVVAGSNWRQFGFSVRCVRSE